MKNKEKRKIRDALLNSKNVIETCAGAVLSLVEPTGLLGETVKLGIDYTITKITDEFDTRILSDIESERVKEVMVTAINIINEKIKNGQQLRTDNFFNNKINDVSDAEEIFESIIIASQREAQKMKLVFYANLLANIGFDKNISSDEAIQVIGYAEKLSYRQCLLLNAICMNTLEYQIRGTATILADKFITDGTEISIPYERISLYQDILELYRMGLIVEVKGNLILTIGQINLHSIICFGIGEKIIRLMELDKLMDNDNTQKHMEDFEKLMKCIMNKSYNVVIR